MAKSIVLFLCTGVLLAGCAKQNGSSIAPLSPTAEKKAIFKIDRTVADSGPCTMFNEGVKLKFVERIGTGDDLGGIRLFLKSFFSGAPASSMVTGLLLHFEHGKPFLLEIRGANGEARASDMMIALDQLTRILSNAKLIRVHCTPSTPYFSTGDLSKLYYMDRPSDSTFSKNPAENALSTVGGVISIQGVEF